MHKASPAHPPTLVAIHLTHRMPWLEIILKFNSRISNSSLDEQDVLWIRLWSSRRKCYIKGLFFLSFAVLTEKHMWRILFLNKVENLQPASSLKGRLLGRCSPVTFAKVLRASFLQNIAGQVLLKTVSNEKYWNYICICLLIST